MNPFFLAVGVEEGPARQALNHNGLASHAQEWNREWHRAQARAWLHVTPEPGLFQDGAGASLGGSPDAHDMDAVAPGLSAVVNTPASNGVQQPTPYARTGAGPAASSESSIPRCSVTLGELPWRDAPGQPEIAGGWRPSTRQAPPERETVHRTASPVNEPRSEKDALRLHVECAGDGLHVWIGADGDAAAVSARAAAILAELRRSEHVHLSPLALVVCNGRTLYASGTRIPSFPETSP